MYINYKAGFTMFANIDFNTLEVLKYKFHCVKSSTTF